MNSQTLSQPTSQQANRYTLFIDSIHEKLTKSKVQSILERFANISSLHLPKIKKGKKKVLMGYGTVEVKDQLSFFNLISEEIVIKGKRIHVETFDLENDGIEEKHQQYLERLVFASNIPKKITASDIKNIFEEKFGPIVSCSKSITATGRIKPFGFVVFQSTQSAAKCAMQRVVLGENFAISVRGFEEEKPSDNKKVLDRKQRIKAKVLQENTSGIDIRKKIGEQVSTNINAELMEGSIEGLISQDRSKDSESKPESSPRGFDKTFREKSNPVLTGTTRCTFPSTCVRKDKRFSEYPKYESSLSKQFRNFYTEMQQAYNFQRHLYVQTYEKNNYVSISYPLQGYISPLQKRATNHALDNSSDCHLRKTLIRKIEKNHNFRNLRINKTETALHYDKNSAFVSYNF